MFSWLKELWDRMLFAFKPTYYVVATPQQALDLVAAKGGTVRFCGGEFTVPKDGLVVPDQHVRIIGANLLIPENGTGLKINAGKKGQRVSIIGCNFTGLGPNATVIREIMRGE